MKKILFFTVFTGATVLLTGCSTTKPARTPAPEPVVTSALPEQTNAPSVQSPLPGEMQTLAVGMVEAGGLAAVGIGESKSLELALNKAKVSGRRELARMLTARFDVLEKAFSAETNIPFESLILSGFNTAEKAIIGQQIAGSVAQTLKYETTGDTFTAYAIMVIDPKVIADQLSKEKDLYTRLQTTQAFGALDKEIKSFAALKAAQK
ncbi:MAG: hypothetical protein HOO88_00485 [Kiritimatiellaceae bacterium]|nr:hypothetical protein [Kiritimatiellaceae bacterium]